MKKILLFMINKEDSKVREKIHDLADRNKDSNNRNFPLDLSLDYSRKSFFNILKKQNNDGFIEEIEDSSVAVIYDESILKGKEIGHKINSYDKVIRVGKQNDRYNENDVGKYTDYQMIQKENFIEQNIYKKSDIIFPNLDSKRIPGMFYDLLDNNLNLYVFTEDFIRFLANFRRIHDLNRIPDYLVSILFCLKLFDVVHFFGLNPYDIELENLVFSFHFKGLITLKDIYE